jgi:hypothetical protein
MTLIVDDAAAGRIALPSTILQFWDLGGQRGMRTIWPKYYDDCHAVVYVIDARDRERLSEGWEVFGMCTSCMPHAFAFLRASDSSLARDVSK